LAPDVGSCPLSKLRRPGQQSKKRDTDCRCFTVGEAGEALDMRPDAVQACIRAGVLAVVDIGCRRLVTAGALLAFVPEKKRGEVRARLDDIERRRGGRA